MPTSAVTTTAAAVSAAQLADIIQWLLTWPVHAPTSNVCMGLAALAIGGAHAAANWWSAEAAHTAKNTEQPEGKE